MGARMVDSLYFAAATLRRRAARKRGRDSIEARQRDTVRCTPQGMQESVFGSRSERSENDRRDPWKSLPIKSAVIARVESGAERRESIVTVARAGNRWN